MRISHFRSNRTLHMIAALAVLLSACDLGNTDDASASACKDGTGVDLAALGITGQVTFVGPLGCERLGADGSAALPLSGLATIGNAALKGTIVLLPGDYDEALSLDGDVKVVGAEPRGVRLHRTLTLTGAGVAHLQSVDIIKASGTGISATGVTLKLDDVRIEGTTATATGAGHGLLLNGVQSAILQSTTVRGSTGIGVFAKGSGAISIVEPIFSKPPRSVGDAKIGIVEPIFQPAALIADNGQGGIAIVEPIFAPKGDATTPSLTLHGVEVRANAGFGVALFGADARIEASAIHGTTTGDKGDWADGVQLLAGKTERQATLEIDDQSVITANARSGVVSLTLAAVTVSAEISNNGFVGLWVSGAGSVVKTDAKAVFWGNVLCAVGATGGADLQMTGSRAGRTHAKDIGADGIDRMVGDGVGVFDGARATIRDAQFVDNDRAAVLVHAAATKSDGSVDVDIDGTTFVGGKYAVVVNGAEVPLMSSSNAYEPSTDQSGGSTPADPPSNKSETSGGVPAQTGFCGSEKANSCVPAL